MTLNNFCFIVNYYIMNINKRIGEKMNKKQTINPLQNYNGSHVYAKENLELGINDYDDFATVHHKIMGADFAKIISAFYIEKILKTSGAVSKLKLLDLACGTGSFLFFVSKIMKNDSRLIGIDLSSGQINTANREKKKQGRKNIVFEVGDVLKADLPKNCQAITMNLDALNHLPDLESWRLLFKKVFSSLAPGGIFLFDINTYKRISLDWDYPEIIIKPGMTYVQVGSRALMKDGVVRRRLYMTVYLETKMNIEKHSVSVEQIAPRENKTVIDMLDNCGFSECRNFYPPSSKHIFMKNRMFVMAKKRG
jgi:SAM-dependent methyltransferase